MRRVRLPVPACHRRLEIMSAGGSRTFRSREAATRAYEEAVRQAAEKERSAADEQGWSAWWSGIRTFSGPMLMVTLYPDDDTRGERSVPILRDVLREAGLVVQERATRVPPPCEDPPVCREGEALMGALFHPDLVYEVTAEVRAVETERQHRFARQRCPRCGRRVVPLEAIHGEPTREGMLKVLLGEASAGCMGVVGNASCPECGAVFHAR